MNKFLFSVLFISLFAISKFSVSQNIKDSILAKSIPDTVLMEDGIVIITPKTEIDTALGILKYISPKHSGKTKTEDIEDVYSIKSKNSEQIIYKPDSIGKTYSVEDMRYFVFGEQDARKRKFAALPFVANTLLSAGAGLTGSFFSPIVPLVFTGLFSLPKVKIRNENVSNPAYLNEDAYVNGYKQEAYRKRKVHTLIGGGIGLAIGLCTSFYLRSQGVPLWTKTY